MYEAFFGLSEKPFALTPNPRFVFQSEQYRTAEQALLYGIAQKEGFMLVTGAPGTGKTTLCRDLLEKLDSEKHRVALIFNPFFNGVEMLQALHSEFGLGDAGTTSRKDLLDRLNAYLLQQLANGRTCIAIFDEAQHLSTEFLEQIRVLSNLETNQEKLIQIILVGQPELLDLIRTPQMAQLDQRVSVRCTLTHL
jgi:general secretion pathway protein A